MKGCGISDLMLEESKVTERADMRESSLANYKQVKYTSWQALQSLKKPDQTIRNIGK